MSSCDRRSPTSSPVARSSSCVGRGIGTRSSFTSLHRFDTAGGQSVCGADKQVGVVRQRTSVWNGELGAIVKPPRFEYACPSTLDEVLDLIATDNAKLLAGGPTLVPILNFRLAAPTLVVDINRVAGLDTVQASDTGLHIGAMVRWHTIESSSVVAGANTLFAQAAGHIS